MKKTYIQDYKFNSVFIKTFIILVLSSIIPVLAANGIIYKQSTSTIQRQTRNANMNMLGKTSETVDLVFKQVDQIMPQLGKDSDILNFIINPDINSIKNNSKIISNLKNISSSNDYILSIYIYSAHSNTILSSSGGVYKLDSFYDKGWLEAYNNFILGTYQMETRKVSDALGNQFNCATLIRNLPYTSWSKLGAIVINISEDKLYDTIEGKNTKGKGEFYVINGAGYILSHKDKSKLYNDLSSSPYIKRILNSDKGYFIQKVKGEQMLFTYVTSPYNGWKYIYTIPLKELQSDSKVVSRIIVIITLIYILLGLFFSFLISKGIYNPIEKLMNMVLNSSKNAFNRENIQVKDEYEFLGYAYNDVLDKNKNMTDLLTNIKPMIKEKLFTNLIMGKNENLEEISEKLGFFEY
ncbi:MAG: two-component system, response regulator YesN [Clostridiales bacterium]|nr:two-component system, response regulator YesN [Clostridiales bacterium]